MRYVFSLFLLFLSFSVLAECEDLHWDLKLAKHGLDDLKKRGLSPYAGSLLYDRDSVREYERRIEGVNEFEIDREQVILEIKRHASHNDYELYMDDRYAKDILKFAKFGDIRSQFCASVLYEFGVGFPKDMVMAYGLAATAVAQNPPFGQHRRDQIASILTPDQQAQGIEVANRLMRSITNLYDQPTTILIK